MTSAVTKDATEHTGGRSQTPPSLNVDPSSSRAANPRQALPTAAAAPVRTFFDPWNSSSTGHQRAENRLSGSTSWRDSRNLKLNEQHKGGLNGGGTRVADSVGAGSEGFGKDGRKANGGWERGAKGLRTGGQRSILEVWEHGKLDKKALDEEEVPLGLYASGNAEHHQGSDVEGQDGHDEDPEPTRKQIFQGLCFYTNGSTAPLVSDHKLKHILAAHGARHSIALGRRSVTHVILGTSTRHGGAGGGLAATKIQKEIARTGGKAVKFITVQWVLESVKAKRRLPESQYSPLILAPKSQTSVFGMLGTNHQATPTRDQG